jgi:hypothetical protein
MVGGNSGTEPWMALTLRTMKKHMGWDDAKDDYVVLDGDRPIGRIYKEHGVVLFREHQSIPSPSS